MKGYIRLAIIGILIFFSSCKNEIEKKVSKMEDLLEDLEEKYDELRDNSQNYAEYEEDKWFFGDDDLIELDLIRYMSRLRVFSMDMSKVDKGKCQ
jgi:hypothetical protein